MINRVVMTFAGKRTKIVQRYQCHNDHLFRVLNSSDWDDSFIETVVYTYLQCLSLNTTIAIIRMFYRVDILTKSVALMMIEWTADALPTLDDIDGLFYPAYLSISRAV